MSGTGQVSERERWWYVYILSGEDGYVYTGCTHDLEGRLKAHQSGKVTSTRGHLPVKVVNYVAFSDKDRAYAFEKYLKSGSGKAFMKRHLL